MEEEPPHQGRGWPFGCWAGFGVAYLWFFAELGHRRPGWDWSVLYGPLFVLGGAALFNTIFTVIGLSERGTQRAELASGYLRSLVALVIVFIPMVIIAWLVMGRGH